MNAIQIFVFALCIYQISASTYEEAVAFCKKESKLENDVPVDYFFQHATWPTGTTTAGCFFNCIGKQLSALDSAGIPVQNTLNDISGKNPTVQELKVLSSPSSFAKCTAEAKDASECVATEKFVSCAVKNAPQPQ